MLMQSKSTEKSIPKNREPSLSSKSSLKEISTPSKSLAKDEGEDCQSNEDKNRFSALTQG